MCTENIIYIFFYMKKPVFNAKECTVLHGGFFPYECFHSYAEVMLNYATIRGDAAHLRISLSVLPLRAATLVPFRITWQYASAIGPITLWRCAAYSSIYEKLTLEGSALRLLRAFDCKEKNLSLIR